MRTFCIICAHSQQASIDARLLTGEALRGLSGEYGVPTRDLRHHRDEHVHQRARRPAHRGRQ